MPRTSTHITGNPRNQELTLTSTILLDSRVNVHTCAALSPEGIGVTPKCCARSFIRSQNDLSFSPNPFNCKVLVFSSSSPIFGRRIAHTTRIWNEAQSHSRLRRRHAPRKEASKTDKAECKTNRSSCCAQSAADRSPSSTRDTTYGTEGSPQKASRGTPRRARSQARRAEERLGKTDRQTSR